MNIDFDEKPQIKGFSTTFFSIDYKGFFWWYLVYNIIILWFQSFIFFIKLLILKKNPKLKGPLPLFLRGSQNQELPLKTNKQTIFFKLQISKSFPLWYPISHASMKKIHHLKHLKTKHFCFSYLLDLLYSIGLKKG